MTGLRRVLITNDDGIAASGLHELARAACEAGLDVIVAAPDRESSGASAALTAVYRDRQLAITRADVAGVATAYSVRASPSYIVVLAALGAFGARPDGVLSGINRGANAGHAVLHSGTVGAALTARNYGIPAMAVSLDVLAAAMADPATGGATLAEDLARIDDAALHWRSAARVATGLLDRLEAAPDDVVLNVNVPNRPTDAIRGIRSAPLAPFGQVQMTIVEAGEGYLRTAVQRTEGSDPATDIGLLAQGFATVTPIRSVRAAEIDIALRCWDREDRSRP